VTKSPTAERDDVGHLASYSIPEAAHYLRIPPATLRSWVLGRLYPTASGKGFFKPPIEIADSKRRLLSFTNLVEVHVLWAIRREHEIPLKKVRWALTFLVDRFEARHPLATHRFETDGADLFVSKVGDLINASREGQLAMREMLSAHLKRVEWSTTGVAVRLYPFTRKEARDEPKAVMIDPQVGFGRPVLVGTGIPTAIIAERFKAGEQPDELARDYGREPSEILEAIRCELPSEAA
jgi:uncharacterized protein (DUF433 family)